jgi:L-alanine-DL-glutamate epimerase-like enolase superfamily enzyme
MARPSQRSRVDVGVDRVDVHAFTLPTDRAESDGTFEWSSTTIVVVEVQGGGETGIGWTYGPEAAATVVTGVLAPVVEGCDALRVGGAWLAMRRALRNAGYPGLGAMALSAVDVALWDLRCRLLDLPLAVAVGAVHLAVPAYGSGGFCSYSDGELAEQLGGWVGAGIPRVKMKIGREPERDAGRVRTARRAIGDRAELYVDANGAFTRKQALRLAEQLAELGVSWFEEPVSSNDLGGLRFLRERGPGGMDVAAGEYAYELDDFRRLVRVVDCLQADVTRCGGVTGLLSAAALAEAAELDLSGHCAPAIHAHALCGVRRLRHTEYFHDHVRIEAMLFDGVVEPEGGFLRPDLSRPGLGVELRRREAERYAA